MIKQLYIPFAGLLIWFLNTSSGCRKPEEDKCDKTAHVIFSGSGGECEILFLTEGGIFEPVNFEQFRNNIIPSDSIKVKLKYGRNFETSNCGADDTITLFCLEQE